MTNADKREYQRLRRWAFPEYALHYWRSPRGLAARKRYSQSPKGRAHMYRHNHSLKGRARMRRYDHSPKGIAKHQKFDATPKRRAAQRAALLKRKYNLTLEEWDTIFASQGGACAMCRRPARDFTKGLAVDHDHSTHLIRGLLCWNCNALLPSRKNLVDQFRRAIIYLLLPPAVRALGGERFANPIKRRKRK